MTEIERFFPKLESGLGKLATQLAGCLESGGWRLALCAMQNERVRVLGGTAKNTRSSSSAVAELAKVGLKEAFRWGEPSVQWQNDARLLVAAASSLNQRLLGGLVVFDIVMDDQSRRDALKAVTNAGWLLHDFLAQHNAVNEALARSRRRAALSERDRAEEIHEWKTSRGHEVSRAFAQLEPDLLLAIRRSDRSGARKLLNAILLHIYNLGKGDFLHTRELIADLVGQMRHAVIACGIDAESHPILSTPVRECISKINDEEDLSPWLHFQLESLIDLLEGSAIRPAALRARLVRDYIEKNCARPLGRDEVATKAGLSPSEFSRMMRRETGCTFTEVLAKARVSMACQLLRSTDLTVQEVGLRCGYEEQAYFSTVFRKITGSSPSSYRKAHIKK